MNSLPRNMNTAAIEFTKPNLKQFLMTSMNAFQADLQKFLLVRAIYRYELREARG